MRRLALIALAAATLLAACSSSRDTRGQATEGFYAASYEMLWDVARREMARAGFPPDMEASVPADRRLVSRWQTQLMPFAGKGLREQATVTLSPVAGRENWWTVETNVTREYNTTVDEPSNPAKADWGKSERVPAKERQVNYGISTFFTGHDVSPQFRHQYGMDPAPKPVSPPAK